MNSKISPSDKNITELVSCTYEDSKLYEIAEFDGKLRELSKKYPFECLRKCGETYRVSYLGVDKIAVLVFDESGNVILRKVEILENFKCNFEGLEKGMTLEAVQQMAPHGSYLFLYAGRNDTPRTSSHYTKDGYLITIEYDAFNVVTDIREELI